MAAFRIRSGGSGRGLVGILEGFLEALVVDVVPVELLDERGTKLFAEPKRRESSVNE